MVNLNTDSNPSPDDGIPPELKAKLEKFFDQMGDLSQAKFKTEAQGIMDAHNNEPNPEINGFSPNMLLALQQHPMGTPNSPLRLSDTLQLNNLREATFFIQMRQMLLALRDAKQVKATPKGNFTRGFVDKMVDTFLHGEHKDRILANNRVLNEEDVFPLHIARIVCKCSGLIGIVKGHYSVRKKALSLLEDEAAGKLYKQLFLTFFTDYNIGYSFRYGPDFDWMQLEAGYALKPLQEKGNHWLAADKLCQVLLHPRIRYRLFDEIKDMSWQEPIDILGRYLLEPYEGWGLIQIENKKKGHFESIHRIRKTRLLDHFVRFELTP